MLFIAVMVDLHERTVANPILSPSFVLARCDFITIHSPLAKKLKDCGVFGVSSDEYLNYALENRREWEKKGKAIVEANHEKILTAMEASNRSGEDSHCDDSKYEEDTNAYEDDVEGGPIQPAIAGTNYNPDDVEETEYSISEEPLKGEPSMMSL